MAIGSIVENVATYGTKDQSTNKVYITARDTPCILCYGYLMAAHRLLRYLGHWAGDAPVTGSYLMAMCL